MKPPEITDSTLFKWLDADGRSCHGGAGKWDLPRGGKPGRWRHVKGELVPCENGIHLVRWRIEEFLEWASPALWIAEAGGEQIDAGNKLVVRKARLLAPVLTWNDRTARLFACDCASRALWQVRNPDPRLTEVLRVARGFARGKATHDELSAAWYAARSAAMAPNDPSGWDAARSAAWDAARSAAWDAARSAAWDAEFKWQQRRLLKYLRGEIR